MDAFVALTPFLMVPMAVFVIAESLHDRKVRILLFAVFVPMIGLVGISVFQRVDGSFASAVSIGAVVYFGGLTLLGLSAPIRFFWAFRALSWSMFLGIVVAGVAPLVSIDRFPAIRQGQREIDIALNLSIVVLFGLPCLWFARTARVWSSKRRFHVFMKETKLPVVEVWQKALHRAGFDLKLECCDDLRKHSGRVRVVFQSVEGGFELDLSPLAILVANAELHEETAKNLGHDCLSANFRYANERERTVAFVAASVITQLTGGRFYAPEHEDWFDGNDALEAAQELMQPLELHVLAMEQHIPTLEQWRQELKVAGLDFDLPPESDLRAAAGFFPVLSRRGATGFAFSLSPAEYVVGGDLFPADEAPREVFKMTAAANFRFAEGRPAAAAAVAAAVFARMTDGYVYNPRKASFSSGPEALELARSSETEDGGP
jgi:hypothetical protein